MRARRLQQQSLTLSEADASLVNPEFNRSVSFAGASPVKRERSLVVSVALFACIAIFSASGADKPTGGSDQSDSGKRSRQGSATPTPAPRKSAAPSTSTSDSSYKKSLPKSGPGQQDIRGTDTSSKKLGGSSGSATNEKTKIKKDQNSNLPAAKLEVKAVQRVFKLAPTFEATDALLADDLHSAQKIYRMDETEFVRRYEHRGRRRQKSRTLP